MTKGDSTVGDFTGLALDDCFNATTENWERARAIINGTDHVAEIAGARAAELSAGKLPSPQR